jgi:DUF1009 family protein
MDRLGLIAGGGRLPLIVAREAARKGHKLFTVIISSDQGKELSLLSEAMFNAQVGELTTIISFFKKRRVKKSVMVGMLAHDEVFKATSFDPRLSSFLEGLDDRRADTLLKGVIALIEQEGISVIEYLPFVRSYLAPRGVLTRRFPSPHEMADVELGYKLAKEIARLDIGQTVMVKNGVVVAIEALEGTDRMIVRGGKLAGASGVVVKVSKPEQDYRFDIPVVGEDTILSLKGAKASVLAIEADNTIIIDKERVVLLANEVELSIVSLAKL